jgi:Fe-S-cluster containining protein
MGGGGGGSDERLKNPIAGSSTGERVSVNRVDGNAGERSDGEAPRSAWRFRVGATPDILRRVPSTDYDCRVCGACCAPEFDSPFYVTIRARDRERLEPRWRDRNTARESLLTRLDGAGRCVCVALRGTVGRRVSCAIYERRPDECRRFEAGSAECDKARAQAGIT